ncbi:MAG: tnpA [Cyanobacteria bacterium RYN_339]|nr:tnpA [Cyanobacteria bacterium RYN_339]
MLNERCKPNPGAVFSLKYHLVWCPEYRKEVLTGSVETRLNALLSEKAHHMGAMIHARDVMPNHVHMIVESDPTKAPAHIAAQFKGFTSRVLRQAFLHLKMSMPCLWSHSDSIGSVGHVSDATVRRFIALQQERG